MAVPADDDDYYRMLGAFTAALAQLEADLRRTVAADVTLPTSGARRRTPPHDLLCTYCSSPWQIGLLR
jgi:hypothetical protein